MFQTFAQHLHRGGDYAYYHILPARRSMWYAMTDPQSPPCVSGGINLYFGVHPSARIPPTNAHGEIKNPAYVRSQIRTIAAINCLFAEFDNKDYGEQAAILSHLDSLCVPVPSALVASGGGVHAYWLLNDPYLLDTEDRRQAARIIQDRWVGVVGGDPGAKDLTRILRVPGSLNYKYAPPRPVAWITCDLSRTYSLPALTAHLPPVKAAPPVAPVRWHDQGRADTIADYNATHHVGDVLEHHGYRWHGRRKMLSPWSSTGQAGVTIDAAANRAFSHHGNDPLHDGYWKRPFDVVRILDYAGDFRRALNAIRSNS